VVAEFGNKFESFKVIVASSLASVAVTVRAVTVEETDTVYLVVADENNTGEIVPGVIVSDPKLLSVDLALNVKVAVVLTAL
jgi:hypothetical protein